MSIKNLFALGLASAISAAALVGCTTAKTTSEAPMSSGAPAQTTEAGGQTASQTAGSTDGLKQVVASTRTAVEAGDFSKAQTEFERFESAWSPIEDGIKAKSPKGYDDIEAGMDKVNSALKSGDKNQALTNLQALNQAIAGVGS